MANVILKKLTGNFKLKIDDLSRTMPMGQTRTLIQGELLLCENQTELGFSISQSDTITVNDVLFEGDLETLQELLGNTVFNEANDPSGRVISYTEGAPVLTQDETALSIAKGTLDIPLSIVTLGDSHGAGIDYPMPLPEQERFYKIQGDLFQDKATFGYSYPLSSNLYDLDPDGKNFSKFNYYSAKWMPDGDNSEVDIERNITAALANNPDIIMCVFTSNEPNFNVTVATAVSRFKTMFELAKSQGVRLWFTGTYPRNAYNATQKQQLVDINEQLKVAVGEDNVMDVLFVLGDENINIKPEYAHGDTVHINGAGTTLVINKFEDRIVNDPGITSIIGYEVYESDNGIDGWVLSETLNGYDAVTFIGEDEKHYKVRRLYSTGQSSPYSNTVQYIEPLKITARFDFAGAGIAAVSGWTAVRGEPSVGVFSATDSNGITCGNNVAFTPSGGGGSAFPNGFGSLLYLDNSGAEQTVPLGVMANLWSEWSDTTKGLLVTGLNPAKSYRFRPFGSITKIDGLFTEVLNNKNKYVFVGATTVTTDGLYNFFQNTDDRVDGVNVLIKPDTNGHVMIQMKKGVDNVLACVVNALEIQEV